MKRSHFLLALPIALLLAGCSSEPAPKTEPAKPAAQPPVTGLSAMYKMYMQARAWAPDCKLLRVGNLDNSQAGKSNAWEATFASESLHRSRRFTYAASAQPGSDLPVGVFGGQPDSWMPSRQSIPFYIQNAKTDTDAALETAMTKAADYAKAHPEMPVRFLLEQTTRFPDPAWRVFWGESVSTSNFSVFVNSITGKYLQTAR